MPTEKCITCGQRVPKPVCPNPFEADLQEWLNLYTEGNPAAVSMVAPLYESYVQWANETHRYVVSRKRLSQWLIAQPYITPIREYGVRLYKGITLKTSQVIDNTHE